MPLINQLSNVKDKTSKSDVVIVECREKIFLNFWFKNASSKGKT